MRRLGSPVSRSGSPVLWARYWCYGSDQRCSSPARWCRDPAHHYPGPAQWCCGSAQGCSGPARWCRGPAQGCSGPAQWCCAPDHRCGLGQLSGGLGQLSGDLGQLSGGLGQPSGGPGRLSPPPFRRSGFRHARSPLPAREPCWLSRLTARRRRRRAGRRRAPRASGRASLHTVGGSGVFVQTDLNSVKKRIWHLLPLRFVERLVRNLPGATLSLARTENQLMPARDKV